MNNHIIINQTLHGYSNGHHLIASSLELSEKSKRKMEVLSDLSGLEIQSGFKEYYTGYYLPWDNKIVLCCTWYANEMERPGCVWSHSLLLEPDDLSTLGEDIEQLLSLFFRPNEDKKRIKDYYLNPLYYTVKNEKQKLALDDNKLQYMIWAILGNETPVLVPVNDSNEYTNEVLYLWFRQSKDLGKEFSFCTGSLTIRNYDSEILNLQFMPKGLIYSVSSSQSKYKILYEKESIKSFPVWVNKSTELLFKDRWSDFNIFRGKFGDKYLNSIYFSPFIKLYIGSKAEKKLLDIAEGLNIIDKIFDLEEKEILGVLLIKRYISNELNEWISEDCSIKILKYLSDINWICTDRLVLQKLISAGLEKDIKGSNDLFNYLLHKENSLIVENIMSLYAEVVPLSMFETFTNMDLDICKKMVLLNSMLAKCICIWKQSLVFQQEILRCMKPITNNPDLYNEVIKIVLNNSIYYNICNDLYNIFRERCISFFIDYLFYSEIFENNRVNIIKNICIKHQNLCLKRIEQSCMNYRRDRLFLIFEIINPYYINSVNIYVWTNIFSTYNMSDLTNIRKRELSLFYLPLILKAEPKFPLNIVGFCYENINSSLANETMPYFEWDKLDKILPKVSWLMMWDKCRRLRKAIKQKGYKLKMIEDDDTDLEIHLL